MNNQVFAPVAETGAPERTLDPEVRKLLPESRDFADHEATKQLVQSEVFPLVQQVMNNRRILESEWHAIQRMWMLVHDSGRRYVGRSNVYLPVYAQARTTLITNLSRGLFPSDDYLDVSDRDRDDGVAANATKTYLQYEFETSAHIRAYLKPFLGQLVDFGTACLKFWYRKQLRPVGKVRQTKAGAEGYIDGKAYDEGLTVSARSMFNVYVYPETAESVRDALLVIEAVNVPRTYVEQMKQLGRWKNVDDGLNAANNNETRFNELQTAQDMEKINPLGVETFGDNKLFGLVPIKEVYCAIPLPAPAYAITETVGTPVPCRVVLMGDVPVSITRNPDFHQCPPYLFARQNVEPGAFYGSWVGRKARGPQYLVNDFANQTNDCGNYALNPILLVNTRTTTSVPPLRPGVTVKTSDLGNSIKFERPPMELMTGGMQQVSQYMGMTSDFSGAPPVLQGTSAGRGARTATATNTLQSNAMGPLQDVVSDIEETVMIPLMGYTWSLGRQYREQALTTRILGDAVKVLPNEVNIDPEFKWLASSQAINRQQRAQGAQQFLAGLPPLLPLLQAQGKTINPEPLLARIWQDGLGFRGLDKVIVPMPPQPQGMPGMPPGMPQEGAPQPMPPGEQTRSPLDNLGGGPQEAAPGTTDGFMEARDGGDEFSRMLGANNAARNEEDFG